MKKCKSKRRQLLFDEDAQGKGAGGGERLCRCKPGAVFGWRPQLGTPASSLAKELRAERRAQRDFLRRHIAGHHRGRKAGGGMGLFGRHRFLKSLVGRRGGSRRNFLQGRGWNRLRRDVHTVDDMNATLTMENEEHVEEVLDVIAEEEIDEVQRLSFVLLCAYTYTTVPLYLLDWPGYGGHQR
jgi:hypothetical protein